MKNSEKDQIRESLLKYVERFPSQNQAAKSLNGVSEATVSQILNGKWNLISPEMWRNIKAQVHDDTSWQHVDTFNYKFITQLLTDAHENHQMYAITGEGGIGKTHTFRRYAATHKNVVWLRCEKIWTQKHMLRKILKGLGFTPDGYSILEMVEEITDRARKRGDVLIIFDQFNKLKDSVKDLIIPIFNDLEDQCGFFISGTNHLKTSFKRGVRLNKEGYQEMYSRMGRKFIDIKNPPQRDVKAICIANGITEGRTISEVWKDCEQDLRRVKRKIHGEKSTKVVA